MRLEGQENLVAKNNKLCLVSYLKIKQLFPKTWGPTKKLTSEVPYF